MIFIVGKLLEIVKGSKTDDRTGEIRPTHTAEILHKTRGKHEVASVKIDVSTLESWMKAIGQDIQTEVRFYALKTREGSIMSGLTLSDKTGLPGVLKPRAVA